MRQRREREPWNGLLTRMADVDKSCRDVGLDRKVLRGCLDQQVQALVLEPKKRCVTCFLSSTFTDTQYERDLLLDDVVPYLQEYARHCGFEFRLVEMRWGIRHEASRAHKMSGSARGFHGWSRLTQW